MKLNSEKYVNILEHLLSILSLNHSSFLSIFSFSTRPPPSFSPGVVYLKDLWFDWISIVDIFFWFPICYINTIMIEEKYITL